MRSIKTITPLLLLPLFIFNGCSQLHIDRHHVGQADLASGYVKSPDPRQKNPPTGDQLWVYWRLPSRVCEEALTLTLRVVYKNLEEEVRAYPIYRRRGHIVFSDMGDSYTKNGGILTYMAEITTLTGEVVKECKQSMWFQPLFTDES